VRRSSCTRTCPPPLQMFYLSCRVKTGVRGRGAHLAAHTSHSRPHRAPLQTAGIYLGLDDRVYLRPFNPEDLATGDDGGEGTGPPGRTRVLPSTPHPAVVGVVDESKLPAPGAGGGRAGAPRAAAGGVKQAITGTNKFVLQVWSARVWGTWKGSNHAPGPLSAA
jgi:hypothetical protein